MTQSLTDAWAALFPQSAEIGRDLLTRWAEPHRRYHDQRHLATVLDTLAGLGGSESAIAAAWWHDAVYDPRGADNEQRSADLAAAQLPELGRPDLVDEVVRLVLITQNHDAEPSDVDGSTLCDADLRVLSAMPSDYERYLADVRAEYSFVDEKDWCTGRSAVLRQLLGLPALFRTRPGQSWENAARRNLTQELASLTGDASPDAGPLR